MKKITFAIGMLLGVMQLSAQDCSELFFSEYLEGSGNNKGLEVYNPTDGIINLGSYYIARYSNGKNTYTDGGITQLEGFIQPYSTHLIVNGQTTSTETSPASDPNLRALAQQLDHAYPAPTYMNGNDAIALFKDTGGSGDPIDFVLVDLFGIIGGGMPSDGEGWASITDQWIYRNIYEGDEIVGQDSTYVTNYIIPDGYYFLRWWIWSANHSLVRKPNIKKGVTAEMMPQEAFNVTLEWDTVPGGQDKWDSLNAHYCECQFGTDLDPDQLMETFNMFPNPAKNYLEIYLDEGILQTTILDLTGKVLYRNEEKYAIQRREIDVEELPAGAYILHVQTGTRSLSRKFLKK